MPVYVWSKQLFQLKCVLHRKEVVNGIQIQVLSVPCRNLHWMSAPVWGFLFTTVAAKKSVKQWHPRLNEFVLTADFPFRLPDETTIKKSTYPRCRGRCRRHSANSCPGNSSVHIGIHHGDGFVILAVHCLIWQLQVICQQRGLQTAATLAAVHCGTTTCAQSMRLSCAKTLSRHVTRCCTL